MYIRLFIYYGSYLAFPLLFFLIWRYKKSSKKSIFRVLFILSSLLIYVRFIEPNFINTKYFDVDINKGRGESMKVVLISDLHIGLYKDRFFLSRVVKKINKIEPDFVLVAGDLTYRLSEDKLEKELEVLAGLRAKTFIITGNHDAGISGEGFALDDVTNKIVTFTKKYKNLKEIDNQMVTVDFQGEKINFIGLSDIWQGRTDFQLLDLIKDEDINFVLSHNPDSVYEFSRPVDLVLSGHTHGGQVRIPFLYEKVIPSDYGFDRYFYNIKGSKVFVSPGLGMVGLPFRFLMPPEIDILNIKL